MTNLYIYPDCRSPRLAIGPQEQLLSFARAKELRPATAVAI